MEKKFRYYNYEQAILDLEPNACFSIENQDLSTLEWQNDSVTRPTDEAIEAQYQLGLAAAAAAQYQFDRKAAYPSMQEQLDMQYWDSVNGTTTWADAIAAVKAQYPKPE